MKIARPLGLVRTVLFFFMFTLSRVPILFIIVASLLHQTLSIAQTILIIIMIFLARSYIESEITGGRLRYFIIFRLSRIFLPFFFITIIDMTLIYYFFTTPLNQLLIVGATLLMVILFYDYRLSNGYFYGYMLPFSVNIVLLFLWIYLLFIPDSLFGKITILLAIYLIEYYNFLMRDNINDFISERDIR